jgi:hypothetical protein
MARPKTQKQIMLSKRYIEILLVKCVVGDGLTLTFKVVQTTGAGHNIEFQYLEYNY